MNADGVIESLSVAPVTRTLSGTLAPAQAEGPEPWFSEPIRRLTASPRSSAGRSVVATIVVGLVEAGFDERTAVEQASRRAGSERLRALGAMGAVGKVEAGRPVRPDDDPIREPAVRDGPGLGCELSGLRIALRVGATAPTMGWMPTSRTFGAPTLDVNETSSSQRRYLVKANCAPTTQRGCVVPLKTARVGV
jgi:hypothetical protein